jgi:hypothetical protein
MACGAISTTGRRPSHSAWEFISLETRPAALRRAVAIYTRFGGLGSWRRLAI